MLTAKVVGAPPIMSRIASFLQLHSAMSTSVVDAFCFTNPLIRVALRIACLPFTLELTRLGMKMEGMVAHDGDLKAASQWLLDIGAAGIQISGVEHVPAAGPLLFVGNHAGLGDAHSLLMASPRRDTKLMAHDFGILPGLRHFRAHVILVEREQPQKALRAALRHLRAGGSLLLYPRGEIEPDPGLYLEPALESLASWSRSMSLFARHVPGLAIVPVAVGGLISRRALRNPVVRRYRDEGRRHFLAATMQMMFPRYRDPLVSLHYGAALTGDRANYEEVLARMAGLVKRVHAEQASLLRQSGPRCAKRDLRL